MKLTTDSWYVNFIGNAKNYYLGHRCQIFWFQWHLNVPLCTINYSRDQSDIGSGTSALGTGVNPHDISYLPQSILQETGVMVGTVDSAQGSTIFSDAKLNVALSNKEGLFIDASLKFLQEVETWLAVVRWCQRVGGHGPKFPQ
ncbi:unnamed protein product [Strongylus vulgaris]|uniref:Uncharacterized protein n=1 Tax=Strongylus vulgaris TaxID=40348 RepID=A0A3P7ITL3_STRVU|nr:unnamed protein product [Strongylus vulgaris]